jgi:hypothetical protein
MLRGARRSKEEADEAKARNQTNHERPDESPAANRTRQLQDREGCPRENLWHTAPGARCRRPLDDTLYRVRKLAPERIRIERALAIRLHRRIGPARPGCAWPDRDQLFWWPEPIWTNPHNVRSLLAAVVLAMRSNRIHRVLQTFFPYVSLLRPLTAVRCPR